MIKRLFDFVFAFLGLILVLPLMLGILLLVVFDSGLPVFYVASRVGRNGGVFRMYKFRTMVKNADKVGGPSTAADDARLTKIGIFLKKYQLDEIPQLINVLKGEMSFVGPRPEVPFYVNMMTDEERKIILSVRPGMTDLASLENFHEGEILRGSLDPERDYMEKIRPRKIKLQMKYVKERSFFSDLGIILKTVYEIFK